MKILLTDITSKNHVFNLEESIRFPDEGVDLSAEVWAKLVFSQHKEDTYNLCGDLTAHVFTSCDRCGNKVQLDVEQEFVYQFILQEEPRIGSEYECTDEDCELLYLADPVVESSDILSEQLLLALPTHIICADGCKGLCDQCGINLNKEQCTCKEINENSPFAILKNLQKN